MHKRALFSLHIVSVSKSGQCIHTYTLSYFCIQIRTIFPQNRFNLWTHQIIWLFRKFRTVIPESFGHPVRPCSGRASL